MIGITRVQRQNDKSALGIIAGIRVTELIVIRAFLGNIVRRAGIQAGLFFGFPGCKY